MTQLWVEEYRPRKISELILPENTKKTLEHYVDAEEIPHLLFVSSAGMGKTSAAKSLAEEMNADYMMINASLQNSIDSLRNEISQFASSMSIVDGGGKKIVILDEADNLSAHFMSALRGFLEEFASNCRFILTANFQNKIIEPIQSRTTLVTFDYENKEQEKAAIASMYHRIAEILEKEGVSYEKKPLARLIQKFFPDFRKTLNTIEKFSASGKIDSSVLDQVKDANIEKLISLLKDQNFTEMRKWVAENSNTDEVVMIRRIYDNLYNFLEKESIPEAVLILNSIQNELPFVADREICLVAGLTRLMLDCSFK